MATMSRFSEGGGMGKGGRPAKPTSLKLLHGDDKKNPQRVNADEPVPSQVDAIPPEWIDEQARAVWERLAPDLASKGVLTAWDVDAFGVLCDAVARHAEAARLVAEHGILVVGDKERLVKNPAAQLVRDYSAIITSYAGRFGLTPSDRAHLSIDRGDSAGGAERLLS